MYSFPNLEPVCCSMSSSNCCFLTCIQISQEAGQVVWYSHLFRNFPQFVVIHTIKAFSIGNKAELNIFLELFCFFCDPMADPMDLLIDHFQFTLIYGPNIPGSYETLFFTASHFCFHHQAHPQLGVVFTLVQPLHPFLSYCFHFDSASSFFPELFLCSSPVAYWAPTDLGSSSFSVISFCLFILFMRFLWQEY